MVKIVIQYPDVYKIHLHMVSIKKLPIPQNVIRCKLHLFRKKQW